MAELLPLKDCAGLQQQLLHGAGSCDCAEFFDYRLQRPDGRTKEIQIIVAPYPTPNDEHDRLLELRDVTWQNGIVHGLAQGGQTLRLITDTVPALITYAGRDERYRFVNAAYEQWFGRPRSEIPGGIVRKLMGATYSPMRTGITKALDGEHAAFDQTVHINQVERHIVGGYAPDIAEDGAMRCGDFPPW